LACRIAGVVLQKALVIDTHPVILSIIAFSVQDSHVFAKDSQQCVMHPGREVVIHLTALYIQLLVVIPCSVHRRSGSCKLSKQAIPLLLQFCSTFKCFTDQPLKSKPVRQRRQPFFIVWGAQKTAEFVILSANCLY
jgi:hypothetical protein